MTTQPRILPSTAWLTERWCPLHLVEVELVLATGEKTPSSGEPSKCQNLRMGDELEVRSAKSADRAGILRVVGEAFASGDSRGREELDIVRAVWDLGVTVDGLELVAVVDGVVVGYVLGSWGELGGQRVVGIAPLAVAPTFQGIGVGSVLMREVIRVSDDSGFPLIVLLGDPAYYQRFGFEPSGPLNIVYGPAGPDSPHFQVRRFAAYTPIVNGMYRYSWETQSSS